MSNVKITKTEILSDNWYTLKKITFDYFLRDGTLQSHKREVYDRGNGATVLLYNRQTQKVVLTKQFRLPTFMNGNETGMMIEACAGMLDEDNPADCARRESEEETGYVLSNVEKIFEAYMSPGSVTEIIYFFIAEYSNENKLGQGGGLSNEQEDIEVLEILFEQAFQMIKSGEIKDGKTIMLLQHLRLQNIL